eukprot:193770-Amphidinium_carterae.1
MCQSQRTTNTPQQRNSQGTTNPTSGLRIHQVNGANQEVANAYNFDRSCDNNRTVPGPRSSKAQRCSNGHLFALKCHCSPDLARMVPYPGGKVLGRTISSSALFA